MLSLAVKNTIITSFNNLKWNKINRSEQAGCPLIHTVPSLVWHYKACYIQRSSQGIPSLIFQSQLMYMGQIQNSGWYDTTTTGKLQVSLLSLFAFTDYYFIGWIFNQGAYWSAYCEQWGDHLHRKKSMPGLVCISSLNDTYNRIVDWHWPTMSMRIISLFYL